MKKEKDPNRIKKGDTVYIIDMVSNSIVPCKAMKISTEDKIKDRSSIETSKKPLWKIAKAKYETNFQIINGTPIKMIFIRREDQADPDRWMEQDLVKKNPSEFINFVN